MERGSNADRFPIWELQNYFNITHSCCISNISDDFKVSVISPDFYMSFENIYTYRFLIYVAIDDNLKKKMICFDSLLTSQNSKYLFLYLKTKEPTIYLITWTIFWPNLVVFKCFPHSLVRRRYLFCLMDCGSKWSTGELISNSTRLRNIQFSHQFVWECFPSVSPPYHVLNGKISKSHCYS